MSDSITLHEILSQLSEERSGGDCKASSFTWIFAI